MSAYVVITVLSLIIIISYFFNILSSKTNIPSVLMLIALGAVLKQLSPMDTGEQLFSVLEVLGIVGLIMIVLEAALDLELKKEKWPLIWKSFSVALAALVVSSLLIAVVIDTFITNDFFSALVYAVPLSIMSSAIIIPSVGGLDANKKEFMVYESTFSDILGIMFFYFLVGYADESSAGTVVLGIILNILLTVTLSVLFSYILVIVFQNVSTQIKLFLLIAVLLLLYAVGKMAHLSSLLIILIFGLILNNYKLFFQGRLKKFIKEDALTSVLHNFHIITMESAFVVRTLFFVIFGATINLHSLLDYRVALIGLTIVAILFGVRYLLLKGFIRKDLFPQVFIAPRGLITILLFFNIPVAFQVDNFDSGILLYAILSTSVIMAWALIRSGMGITPVEEPVFNYWKKVDQQIKALPTDTAAPAEGVTMEKNRFKEKPTEGGEDGL